MSAPLFSVVIPTHQHAEFIGDTVGCVLAQTFEDYEIIVVDNGSTDGTDEIVQAIDDPRIRYHWQQDSGLPANSRNVGVDMASGALVAFLDSDDVWYPQKLAKAAEAFDSESDVDVWCHGVSMTRGGREIAVRAITLPPGESAYDHLLYAGNFMTTSASVVRRERLREAGGFSERRDLVTAEDYDLWLRLAARGSRFALSPEVLGAYVLHSSNASAQLERTYDNAYRALDEQCIALAKAGDLDIDRAVARRRRGRLAMIRDLGRAGHPAAAARWLAALPGELGAARARYAEAAAS